MPTWGEILKEFNKTLTPQGVDTDSVRVKYLRQLAELTSRPAILYATAFLESRQPAPPSGGLLLSRIDVQGFMECIHGLTGDKLDLIILSPGGSAEAAEAIVSYLRSKFSHIRAIVPFSAMSAATMLTLAADEIVMARHSFLGPIDPQFTITTPEGPRSSPAQAILDQFEQAKLECKDQNNLPAWLPILRSYAPGLLAQCTAQRDLAKLMVSEWLSKYMFKEREDAQRDAEKVAGWFSDYQSFKSHGRSVGYEQTKALGLNVKLLEEDQKLQDAVLSVHHAIMHTFNFTGAYKIIENHLGYRWVQLQAIAMTRQGPRSPTVVPEQPPPPAPTSTTPQGLSRQQRREWERKNKR